MACLHHGCLCCLGLIRLHIARHTRHRFSSGARSSAVVGCRDHKVACLEKGKAIGTKRYGNLYPGLLLGIALSKVFWGFPWDPPYNFSTNLKPKNV